MQVRHIASTGVTAVVVIVAIVGGHLANRWDHPRFANEFDQSRPLSGFAAHAASNSALSEDFAGTFHLRDLGALKGNVSGIQYFPEVLQPGIAKLIPTGNEAEDDANQADLLAFDRNPQEMPPLVVDNDDEIQSAPAELLPPEDASHMDLRPGHFDAEIRDLIQQELPNATAEEQNIWFDELKGLPPNAVRDILRLRSRISRPRARFPAPLTDSQTDDSQGRDQPLVEPPRHGTPHSGPGLSPTLVAVLQARDVILNNISNADTIGFKRTRVVYEDLNYGLFEFVGAPDPAEEEEQQRLAIGIGSRIAATLIDHSPGRLSSTSRDLDLAIEGPGFFQVELPNGNKAYTRASTMTLDSDRNICLMPSSSQWRLSPTLTIPEGTIAVQIAANGNVSAACIENDETIEVGEIRLVRFIDPAALQPLGKNLFLETSGSGPAMTGQPGTTGFGSIRQGFVEESNVDLEVELRNLERLKTQLSAIATANGLNAAIDTASRGSAPGAEGWASHPASPGHNGLPVR